MRAAGPATKLDLEELRLLQERAYGAHADINDDPGAFARLIELQDARVAAGATGAGDAAGATGAEQACPSPTPLRSSDEPPPAAGDGAAAAAAPAGAHEPRAPKTAQAQVRGGDGTAPPQRAWAKHRTPIAVGLGVLVAVIGSIAVTTPGAAAPPEATLRPTGTAADATLLALMATEGSEHEFDRAAFDGDSEMEIDPSTLRSFGRYRAIEVWSARNVFESTCLIAVNRGRMDVVARSCVPEQGLPVIDVGASLSLGGGLMRFSLRDDTVDVHVFSREEASG
ncbi:hypothetical protein GCM10010460_04260 [Microbacterium terrae]|uniref:Uncharacterized protein n=2 Tax=Microbacterium terrae TaxID=69369 RepID=A0A0M2GXQ1_9MICO|nr:hypothetical protein RS81_02544 [Microbacterium terrae]GLJ96988.1 hypothetical protein GCM10017594_01850 [Microbacterium terrae]